MLENNAGNTVKHVVSAGWKITIAGFIDAVIAILLEILLIFYRQPTFVYQSVANINTSFLALIILVFIRFIFIVFFDRSIGMMLFRLVFLNHEEKHLNIIEKICAGLFLLIRGVEYYEYQ
jgi:hypothetical protein